jgi:2,4-didehydro-3-deoxy-L-rhamnonate hydrolase
MAVRTWCALASYAGASGAQPALVVAEECYDMAALLAKIEIADAPKRALAAGVDAALAQWALVEPALHVLTAGVARAGVAPLAAPKLLAPYRPSRIFAAAANYSDHAREMGGTPGSRTETEPYFFPKADSAVIGTGATVVKPARVEKLDWEVELAVIIGRGGRDIRARAIRTRAPTCRSSTTGSAARAGTRSRRSGRGSCRPTASPTRRI